MASGFLRDYADRRGISAHEGAECFECLGEPGDAAGYLRIGGKLRLLCADCFERLDPSPDDEDTFDTIEESRLEV